MATARTQGDGSGCRTCGRVCACGGKPAPSRSWWPSTGASSSSESWLDAWLLAEALGCALQGGAAALAWLGEHAGDAVGEVAGGAADLL